MALWITCEPQPGLTPHRFYVVVTPYARKTRVAWRPADDAELQAWIENQGVTAAERTFTELLAKGMAEEEAQAKAAEVGRLAFIRARDSGQYEFGKFDQRATAVVEFFADNPGDDLAKRAQPYRRIEVAYDHDWDAPGDGRAQAYQAVKDQFPGQWEDAD